MSSVRSIKQRIANVSSAEQIIKAMNMVASTKLLKVRAQLEGVRPIYGELKRIVEELGNQKDAKTHIFYKEREVKNSLYIIISSDRGLSGSYNSNIMKKALEHMNQGKNENIYIVGSKGHEFFKKKDKNIVKKVTDLADAQVYYGTENIVKSITKLYLSGKVEEVFVCYTYFENVLSNIPVVEKILPMKTGTDEEAASSFRKYEPSLDEFIEHVTPLYLHMNLFRAFSESHTSEQAARMINMDAAGKNASDIIEELTNTYNRKRQAAITQELSEIVGSANILKKGGLT